MAKGAAWGGGEAFGEDIWASMKGLLGEDGVRRVCGDLPLSPLPSRGKVSGCEGLERVAFNQLSIFTLAPEAAIALANAFGGQSEFDLTRHALSHAGNFAAVVEEN